MGICPNTFKLLVHAIGLDFTDTLQVGRQNIFMTPKEMKKIYPPTQGDAFLMGGSPIKYAEPLFRCLGAKNIESCDISSNEGATHVFNLSASVPEDLVEKYTLVYDGGTSEHCCSPFHTFKNIMSMVKPGGAAIFVVPANNLMGHGFWQYTPDFFYRIAAANRLFSAHCVAIVDSPFPKYYLVPQCDQFEPRHRLESIWPVWLFVVVHKLASVPMVQQALQTGYNPEQQTFSNVTPRTGLVQAFINHFGGVCRWIEPIYYRFIQRKPHYPRIKLKNHYASHSPKLS